jgi:hypothetical protein
MIYKYRPININTIKTLLHNSLYCCNPVYFNDPFDSNFSFDYPEDFNNRPLHYLDSFIYNIIEKEDPKVANDLRANAKVFIEKGAIDELKSYIRAQFEQSFITEGEYDIGVLCFSKVFDNILMWSHYADEHKGLVLGFDTSKEPLIHAKPVDYPVNNELLKTSIKNLYNEILVDSLFKKSKDWEKEEEVRYVNPNGPGYITYPSDALKSIHFGCRTTDEDIETVIKILKDKKQEVKYYKARKDNNYYKLQFNPLNK